VGPHKSVYIAEFRIRINQRVRFWFFASNIWTRNRTGITSIEGSDAAHFTLLVDRCLPGKENSQWSLDFAWSKERPCTTLFDNGATFVEKCLVFAPFDGHTSLDRSMHEDTGQTVTYAVLTKV